MGRAEELVSTGRLHLSGANNKIKHGIAARPDDATKITFTTQPPDEQGNVKLSSLRPGQGVDLFDRPFLDYISRPPTPAGTPEPLGFERTWLRVDTSVVLAEAWMLAMVHGAVFSTAAHRHFGEKPVDGVPPHPGVFIGPSPLQVQGGPTSFTGARFPLTTSSSGRVHRPPGMAFADGSFVPWTVQHSTSGVVEE